MNKWIEPGVLTGDRVVLEPLEQAHAPALAEAVRDGELWRLWYTFVPAPDAVDGYIDTAHAERAAGGLAFAVSATVLMDSGNPVHHQHFVNRQVGSARAEQSSHTTIDKLSFAEAMLIDE